MKRLTLFAYGLTVATLCSFSYPSRAASLAQLPSQTQEADAIELDAVEINVEEERLEDGAALRVGTKEIVPFVFLEDQIPYGYSIDVWSEISNDLNFTTEWVRYDSVSEMLQGLLENEIDVAIAAISITAEREAAGLDFSYPFYRSGLQVMIQTPRDNRWRAAFLGLLSWNVWRPFLLVMATSAGVAILIWMLERNHNESFSKDPLKGIGQGLWFSIVTLGTFGYGDVTPTRLPARIIACLWMGASFFIVADFIASLTVDQLSSSNISFENLRGEAVGVISGTTAEIFVRAKPVDLVEFETFDEMVLALEAGELEAVVHDYPALEYVASRQPETFALTGDTLTQEGYGLAFQEDSTLIEPVSQKVLKLQEQGTLQSIEEKWFSDD